MVTDAHQILADRGEEQIPAGTTLHTLHHTCASLLIRQGKAVEVVPKRPGHPAGH